MLHPLVVQDPKKIRTFVATFRMALYSPTQVRVRRLPVIFRRVSNSTNHNLRLLENLNMI